MIASVIMQSNLKSGCKFMNKIPLNLVALKKIIQTTQAIEGYKPAKEDVVRKVQQLKQQYGLQVSPRK